MFHQWTWRTVVLVLYNLAFNFNNICDCFFVFFTILNLIFVIHDTVFPYYYDYTQSQLIVLSKSDTPKNTQLSYWAASYLVICESYRAVSATQYFLTLPYLGKQTAFAFPFISAWLKCGMFFCLLLRVVLLCFVSAWGCDLKEQPRLCFLSLPPHWRCRSDGWMIHTAAVS